MIAFHAIGKKGNRGFKNIRKDNEREITIQQVPEDQDNKIVLKITFDISETNKINDIRNSKQHLLNILPKLFAQIEIDNEVND